MAEGEGKTTWIRRTSTDRQVRKLKNATKSHASTGKLYQARGVIKKNQEHLWTIQEKEQQIVFVPESLIRTHFGYPTIGGIRTSPTKTKNQGEEKREKEKNPSERDY